MDDKIDSRTPSSSSGEKSATDTAVATNQSTLKFNDDMERAASTTILPVDPFQFRDGIVSEDELTTLRNRRKGKHIAKYQKRQNDLINDLLKPMEEHTEDAKQEEEAARLPVKIAVYASLIANFALCVLQMYAAASSLSLSLLATGIDSVFDIGSNVLLFFLHRKAAKLDVNKWPVGGARLETIGNIVYGAVFAFIYHHHLIFNLLRLPVRPSPIESCSILTHFSMGSVNLVVIVESTRTLVTKEGDELAGFHLPSIIAVGAALAVKFMLFVYCYSIRKKSSQVQVLWEDHRNDLWINGFGILMSTGGSKLKWFLDPMGAIIIALGVIISWGRTVYQQFELLAGKSAPHEFLQLVIYKAATFSDEIDKVDTVRAYHSGPDYFLEVDVVMDASTPLWKAHDISQQLQDKLEVLPNVERAFVHVDHEWTHIPVRKHS
ncbi:hypothetical protein CVT24_005316 [Panaeolus cyanescens]|uniref:Uncharacterized protein n=1 Tax=Panaeolus cyanescens TaxID=181874 RepID=A0A409Y8X2_9AGAR|nr:hypothetical protein CVT24_005316 [Panaeolus cyanescens]